MTWTGEGNPFWEGRPHADRIRRIQALTAADSQGRLYWRPGFNQEWKRLDLPATTKREYQLLNQHLSYA